MFTITHADNTHIPKLKLIWKTCFGDSNEYIDFFFDNCFPHAKCVVLLCDKLPIGAMYLMDIKADEYALQKNGYYVYAVAILPEYRGRGLFKKMHDALAGYLTSQNMFSALCPANEKLCRYYAGLGYVENSFVTEMITTPSSVNKSYHISDLEVETFKQKSEIAFGVSYINWEDTMLSYILLENSFCGGFNLVLKSEKTECFVIGKADDSSLYITESDVSPDHIQDVTDFLCLYTFIFS